MALEIDPFAVLRAIGANQTAFSSIRAEVAKAQGTLTQKLRMLLVKQIKASAADPVALKDIRKTLGAETFDLVVDGMKDTELKALVGKLDKHHPQQKTASAHWRRQHLSALMTGAIQPSPKMTSKGKKAAERAKPAKEKKELDFLFDESAGAVRKTR